MNRSQLVFVGLLCLLLVWWWISSESPSEDRLCTQEYALCTSAPCIPDPNDHTKAICFCDVERGPSMSTIPCKELQPTTDSNGIRTVYSTFPLKQLKDGKRPMNCPSSTPWTWCLNKKCTINPANPSQAICSCDIKRNKGEWTTFGGDQDASTCSDTYWSGALLQDAENGGKFLQKNLPRQET